MGEHRRAKTSGVRLGSDERLLLAELSDVLTLKLEGSTAAPGVTEILREATIVLAAWLLHERAPRIRFARERRWRRGLLELIARRADEGADRDCWAWALERMFRSEDQQRRMRCAAVAIARAVTAHRLPSTRRRAA